MNHLFLCDVMRNSIIKSNFSVGLFMSSRRTCSKILHDINSDEEKKPVQKKAKVLFSPPQNWEIVYDVLKKFRYETLPPAPVDTMGCDLLFSKEASRFNVE